MLRAVVCLLTLCLALGPCLAHPIVKRSLYEVSDPVTVLNSTSYGPTVLGKQTAWVVEFYMSWCGFCKRYAPIYKEFAKDVYGWHKIVRVGVVECSDPSNTNLCKHYQIRSVPNTKFFWHNIKWDDMGVEEINSYNATSVRFQLLDFLEENMKTKSVPDFWPQLRPYSTSELAGLRASVDADTKVYAVLEAGDNYIGKEIVMGSTSSPNKIRVVRVPYQAAEHGGVVSGTQLPALVEVQSDGTLKLIKAGNSEDQEGAKIEIIQTLGGETYREGVTGFPTPSTISPTPPSDIPRDKVFLQDLEKALHYSINQEIGLREKLEGEEMKAFKDYLDALVKYFPARPPVKAMLTKIKDWTKDKTSVNVKELMSFIKESTTEDAYLPDHKSWKGCRGSLSGYRGYPCGLWTTFHTLTVRAYLKYKTGEDRSDPMNALYAIRGYVKNFFGCRYCAEHFMEMARGIETETSVPEDAPLWLWRAHNKVNNRLAGDLTEDPLFPKIQFPPYHLCPSCKIANDEWDQNAVLKFLIRFYVSLMDTNVEDQGSAVAA